MYHVSRLTPDSDVEDRCEFSKDKLKEELRRELNDNKRVNGNLSHRSIYVYAR